MCASAASAPAPAPAPAPPFEPPSDCGTKRERLHSASGGAAAAITPAPAAAATSAAETAVETAHFHHVHHVHHTVDDDPFPMLQNPQSCLPSPPPQVLCSDQRSPPPPPPPLTATACLVKDIASITNKYSRTLRINNTLFFPTAPPPPGSRPSAA